MLIFDSFDSVEKARKFTAYPFTGTNRHAYMDEPRMAVRLTPQESVEQDTAGR